MEGPLTAVRCLRRKHNWTSRGRGSAATSQREALCSRGCACLAGRPTTGPSTSSSHSELCSGWTTKVRRTRCLLVLLTHACSSPGMNPSQTGQAGCGNSLVCAAAATTFQIVRVQVPGLPAPTLPTACACFLCCCVLHRVNPRPRDVTLQGMYEHDDVSLHDCCVADGHW